MKVRNMVDRNHIKEGIIRNRVKSVKLSGRAYLQWKLKEEKGPRLIKPMAAALQDTDNNPIPL